MWSQDWANFLGVIGFEEFLTYDEILIPLSKVKIAHLSTCYGIEIFSLDTMV
jgi:hypothetical protein